MFLRLKKLYVSYETWLSRRDCLLGVCGKKMFFLHVADFVGFSLLLMCFCEYVYVS